MEKGRERERKREGERERVGGRERERKREREGGREREEKHTQCKPKLGFFNVGQGVKRDGWKERTPSVMEKGRCTHTHTPLP